MSEDNLKIKGQLDTSNSVSALLPTGIIILKGSMQYSAGENNLSEGFCPCDGRALNTYTYRNLHRVISDIYGGTAFSDGLTNVPTATTTFNVPNILNFPSQSYNTNTAVGLGTTAGNINHSHVIGYSGTITLTESAFYDHSHNANINWNGSNDHGHGGVGGGVVTTGGPIPGSGQGKRDGNSPNRIAGVFHGHSSFTRAVANFGGGGGHGHSGSANQGSALNTNPHNHTTTLQFSNISAASTLPEFTNLTALIKL
jgi:hypothetical protein